MVAQINIVMHQLFTYYFFFLEFSIIVDIEEGTPGHLKYVVYCLNDRDKRMLKLSMENLLNPEEKLI